MNITDGHFTLSPEQRRFKDMLNHHPYLESYFDFKKKEVNVVELDKSLGSMSDGEAIIARFLSSIWLGENRFNFDLIDAMKTLDSESIKIISDWIKEPFWP